ncbi:MAG: hypothetical protein WAO02_00150 [Verrucomicrobiia bacterium]
MSRATPPLRNFARCLLVYEALDNKSSGVEAPAAFPVCEKLRRHLATFMGKTGFHTLLARSLALSNAEVPWLCSVRARPDDSLEGLEELHARLAPEEFSEGEVVLLAQLLGLLVAFIGEKLTVRLVCEVWPDIPLDGWNSDEGNKNEEAK